MQENTVTCRTCGLEFVFPEEKQLWKCPACGANHARPKSQGSSLQTLREANFQRASCDFVHAEAEYRRVLSDHPDEHEARWGLVLCKYGVEYVSDERTHEHKPVVHFLRRKPITEDADCKYAISCAPEEVRRQYEQDAAYISEIQTWVIRAEAEAEPYDIFLCYKGSDPDGEDMAKEYYKALQLYPVLVEQGYRVFFAHHTLQAAAGANYEARIYHALHTAKVMLVVCRTPAYLNTPWVHSEWSRYLERVDDPREDCTLIPLLYDGCDPYALPEEFKRRALQGMNMSDLTSLDVLRERLRKLLRKEQPAPEKEQAGQARKPEKPWKKRDFARRLLAFVTAVAVLLGTGWAVKEWETVKNWFVEAERRVPELAGTAVPAAVATAMDKPTATPTPTPTPTPVETPTATPTPTPAETATATPTPTPTPTPVETPTATPTPTPIQREVKEREVQVGDYEITTYNDGTCEITDYTGKASVLEIPEWLDGYKVTGIGDFAFSYHRSLTSVTIPEGVTSIGDFAFRLCESLTSVTIPAEVTSIGDFAFEQCSSLTNVTLPERLTSIGSCAFQGCSSLMSVTIPEGVTSIGSNAFQGCSSLTSVMILEGVTSIEFAAFAGCSSLTSVIIPVSVTSIGPLAFSDCCSLTSLEILEGITSIDLLAFLDCLNLTLLVPQNSYAATYAQENDIPYTYID